MQEYQGQDWIPEVMHHFNEFYQYCHSCGEDCGMRMWLPPTVPPPSIHHYPVVPFMLNGDVAVQLAPYNPLQAHPAPVPDLK